MDKIKVAVYCRVSTDSRDQANSFENQKSYFEREIDKNPNYELVKIYADRGISGTKLERPEFNQMIEDAGLEIQEVTNSSNDKRKEYLRYRTVPSSIQKPKFNMIITKNTSRFARNMEVGTILNDLKKNKVYVHFLDLDISTEKDSDITYIQIFQSIDERDSRDKSVKVKFGMEEGAKHGVVHTNSKLYGYRYIQAENRLEIIPEEAEVVKLIYTLYANGFGARQIINTLTDSNIMTRQGKPFCKSTVRRILDNEKYAGLNNALKYDTGVVFNKNSYPKVKEQYLVEDSDKIPAIIDPPLFDKCRGIRKGKVNYVNQKGIYKGKAKYSGLIRCGNCGSAYHSNTDKGRIFYNCSNKKLHGMSVCNNPNISESFLDSYISSLANGQMYSYVEKVKDISVRRIYKEIMVQYQRINSDRSNEAKITASQIQELRGKLDRYIEVFAMGESSQNIVKDKIKETELQINELQRNYKAISESNVCIANRILTLYNTAQKVLTFQNKETYTKEELINIISKITIYKNGNGFGFTPQIKPLEEVTTLVEGLDSIWEDEEFDENEIDKIVGLAHDIVS